MIHELKANGTWRKSVYGNSQIAHYVQKSIYNDAICGAKPKKGPSNGRGEWYNVDPSRETCCKRCMKFLERITAGGQ